MGEKFGGMLRRIRREKHLSLRALGMRASYSDTHLCDVENGAKTPTVEMAKQLDVALGTGTLFRDKLRDVDAAPDEFSARSHKFLPAHIGADAVPLLVDRLGMTTAAGQWFDGWTAPIDHPAGPADLWVWPWGVAIIRITEEAVWPDLSHLATWRYATYPGNIMWASDTLTAAVGAPVKVDYALSAYWVHQTAWTHDRLATAMQVLSMPRVVTGDQGEAEQRLLAEGWSHPDIQPFGVTGVSVGYASWSGVAYCPVDHPRALTEDQLVACELAVQAVWEYAAWSGLQAEQGLDPVVPAAFGWRFLRGLQSRLSVPRPQETMAHRSMRDAILATSDLGPMLSRATQTLRDAA